MPSETISRTVTDGVESPPVGRSYEWTAGYDISMPDVMEGNLCEVTVTMKIKLNPDANVTPEELTACKTRWATNITTMWSGKFQLCLPKGQEPCEKCPCECIKITVKVEWVTEGQHHTVRVRRGPATSNSNTWDTSDGSEATKPNAPAHEFGHLLGLKDEYQDTENAPERTVGDADSVMRTTGSSAKAKSSHFQFVADWVNKNLPDCDKKYEVR